MLYDEYAKDDKLKELLALADIGSGLTFKERDIILGSIEAREAEIKKEYAEEYAAKCNKYREKHKHD